MPRARVVGTGSAVPSRVVTNDQLSHLMETSDEWIRTRTGIGERHWVEDGETNLTLSLAASRAALDAASLTPADLDAIVFATSTADHFAPGNGVLLQAALGAGTIPALDVRTQCSGFIYALSVADAWIRVGLYRRILVVGSEVQSTGMDVTTRGRNTAVIFADGAGAVVLAADEKEGHGILGFDLHGDGSNADKLWVPSRIRYDMREPVEPLDPERNYLQMDGKEVFRHAVVRMPESVTAVLTAQRLTTADLALLIPHQANLRISEMIQRTLGLRDDQVYNNIERYGNTTSATIPLALDECARAGRLAPGDLVALTAFGSGFLWGSCLLRW